MFRPWNKDHNRLNEPMLFKFSKQVGILNFEAISPGDNPCAANVDGVERSRLVARAVSLAPHRSVYLCLAYYCHIKIRTLHFVSNFQFSLYRMLARVRRLACRHSSLCTCLCRALGLLHIWIISSRRIIEFVLLFWVSYWTLIEVQLNGIHGFLQHVHGGPSPPQPSSGLA